MLPRSAVLHALMLLAFAIASCGAKKDPGNDGFQTINFAIDWTGGVPSSACNSSCVSTSFACSDGRGTWDGGELNFMDPFEGPASGKTFLPIAVNLTINGYFNCNDSSFRQMFLLMQGSLIGPGMTPVTLPASPIGCDCPGCANTAGSLSLSQTWPGGIDHYQLGGMNEFRVLLLQNGTGENSVCFQSFNVTIEYADVEMTLREISPTLGLITGGTPVNVFGSFIPPGDLYCSFGDQLVPAIWNSNYACECTAPSANVSGDVAFRLVSGDVSSRNPLLFQYYDPPTVLSISPSSCSADKTVQVTITGSDFPSSNFTQVSFFVGEHESAASDVVWVSSRILTCTSPPLMRVVIIGSADGDVESNASVSISFDGQFYFGNLTFTYLTPPSNNTRTPILTYVVWSVTALTLVVIVIFIGVLIARAYCGCGYAEYEVVHRDEESLWHNADIKQISPAEIVLGERVGKGSFGQVFRGTWRGTQVAVKKLHMPMLVDDTFVREFKNEIDVMRRVSHPNCLQFLGASLIPPDIVIVTEYMSRGSLYRILHSNQALSWDTIRNIVLDTCRGMCYLHGSNPVIIHRDLKSHNLLLDDNWRTKVCDFGLSKVLVETGSAAQLTACGTPCWTAPEVIKNQLYTTKADVYSFGIVLWEMITREDPFKGMPPFQVVFAVGTRGLRPTIPSECPPFWDKLMRACWSENPDERPPFEVILERVEGMT